MRSIKGVVEAQISFSASTLAVAYDPDETSAENIARTVESFGYEIELPQRSRHSVFTVKGMDCPDCAERVTAGVKALPGVVEAKLDFATAKLSVDHNEIATPVSSIVDAVEKSGYEAVFEGLTRAVAVKRSPLFLNRRLLATFGAGVFLVAAFVVELFVGARIAIPLYAVAILVGGYFIAKSAVLGLKNGVFDMYVLMSIAAIGAATIGEWSEGATVLFLFSLGNALEAFALDRTRASIKGLIELSPEEALVRRGDRDVLVPVEEVHLGEIAIVKPGDRIPLDGIVVKGDTSVNQATITGESRPVIKMPGESVFAGTINQEGYVEIETTKVSKDSALSRIIRLVEEAQADKAPTQRILDRFSHYYTPTVVALAALVAFVPPLFGLPFRDWFFRALVLLVISCPCALVISTPVSIISAIGAASRHGVLFKGGSFLETTGAARVLIFDKTGTLTSGQLRVAEVVTLDGTTPDRLAAIASSLERKSRHPLAKAITEYAHDSDLPELEAVRFKSFPGKGVVAEVEGATYYLGNERLFEEVYARKGDIPSEAGEVRDGSRLDQAKNVMSELRSRGMVAALLGTEREILGAIGASDTLRPASRETIGRLHEMGVGNIIMLTGDARETASEVSKELHIDGFRSELLPEDKVDAVRELSQKHGVVVMVGDGVNDAPALAVADVGIAMGAAGADIALETSDVALMSDDLSKIPYAIRLSRRTVGAMKQNIAASILVKAAFIVLALIGIATLWMAVFADVGVSLLVTANGLRLFRTRA